MNRAIRKIENYLQTESGQRFLQYGYSFGAAIVIFGALIKVLHIWGIWGNIIFAVGMIAECIVFILYGLDKPGKNYDWEKVFPVFDTDNPNDRPKFGNMEQPAIQQTVYQQSPIHTQQTVQSAQTTAHRAEPLVRSSEPIATATPQNVMYPEIEQISSDYTNSLETLNRNIGGLNTIYEIQLKSISGQIETLDQINSGLRKIKHMYTDTIPDGSVIKEETEKMAEQLRELNRVYARMLEAMTAYSKTENRNS